MEEPSESLALFGERPDSPVFILRCANGVVGLAREASNSTLASRVMVVRTETRTRNLIADAVSAPRRLIAAELSPRDPLLDAMAITKGRFAVEVEGERTLYLPAWAEVTRVIEDCR